MDNHLPSAPFDHAVSGVCQVVYGDHLILAYKHGDLLSPLII